MKVVFDDMCREVLKCDQYIEWDLELEMADHGRNYESTITCVSCQAYGQSYNIEAWPESCPHKKALMHFKIRRKAEMAAFEKEMEQIKMWDKLSDT